MPLTVVSGSYKSGKTALLDDVYKQSSHLTYIRQAHKIRPDIRVKEITSFDPTSLPFWHLYGGMEDNVVVGGLLNGKYRAGLNGCQQKLLLFEMLYQQTASQSKLSLALDEPFEMVSTEYLPFVIDRLNSLRERHHVVISTCDHIRALSEVADITLGVNPFNPHVVKVNNREYVDREEAIMALSVFDRRAKYYIDDEPAVDSGGATTAEGHSNREYHEAQRDATVTPETLEQEPMAMEVSGLTADLTNEVTVTDLDPAVLDYIEPQPECVELY